METEHLKQRVTLDSEAGDPITWRQIATVPDTATVTAGRLVVKTKFGGDRLFADIEATNIQGPQNPAEDEHEFTLDFELTRDHTLAISASPRRWSATVTTGGVERTFASGEVQTTIPQVADVAP